MTWLIEAPGQNYLGTREVCRFPEFFWTADHDQAVQFTTSKQADGVMMTVRRMAPELFAFAVNLGEAKPAEHLWVSEPPQPPPDPDGWIPWHGGECPVDGETMVEVRFQCGEIDDKEIAGFWGWQHIEAHDDDIIAYRPLKPTPPKPDWSSDEAVERAVQKFWSTNGDMRKSMRAALIAAKEPEWPSDEAIEQLSAAPLDREAVAKIVYKAMRNFCSRGNVGSSLVLSSLLDKEARRAADEIIGMLP